MLKIKGHADSYFSRNRRKAEPDPLAFLPLEEAAT